VVVEECGGGCERVEWQMEGSRRKSMAGKSCWLAASATALRASSAGTEVAQVTCRHLQVLRGAASRACGQRLCQVFREVHLHTPKHQKITILRFYSANWKHHPSYTPTQLQPASALESPLIAQANHLTRTQSMQRARCCAANAYDATAAFHAVFGRAPTPRHLRRLSSVCNKLRSQGPGLRVLPPRMLQHQPTAEPGSWLFTRS
jgi:hypothetical protein